MTSSSIAAKIRKVPRDAWVPMIGVLLFVIVFTVSIGIGRHFNTPEAQRDSTITEIQQKIDAAGYTMPSTFTTANFQQVAVDCMNKTSSVIPVRGMADNAKANEIIVSCSFESFDGLIIHTTPNNILPQP